MVLAVLMTPLWWRILCLVGGFLVICYLAGALAAAQRSLPADAKFWQWLGTGIPVFWALICLEILLCVNLLMTT